MKPLLAAKLGSIEQVKFPVWATPKLDGIRCLITDAGPVSRKLKPIPNHYVRGLLKTLPKYLDGELMIPGAANFGEITSAIMSEEGEPHDPHFEYHVFDRFFDEVTPSTCDYLTRVASLGHDDLWPKWVKILRPVKCSTPEELLALEAIYLDLDYEGVMLRQGSGGYKFGRSTVREGLLLKLKQFEDFEAEVIGFEELQHNENEQTRDALGNAKRSTHKAGKVPGGTLGTLLCRRLSDDVEFGVGSGLTAAQREEVWANRPEWMGAIVRVRSQASGAKDAPRFPVFQGRRAKEDM